MWVIHQRRSLCQLALCAAAGIAILGVVRSGAAGQAEVQPAPDNGSADRQARRILRSAATDRGFLVHLGCGEGNLTVALGERSRYVVQGLDRHKNDIKRARRSIHSAGCYGRVSAEQWNEPYLPYASNLVDVLVVDERASIPRKEIRRVLSPRGMAFYRKEDGWERVKKPWPEELGPAWAGR